MKKTIENLKRLTGIKTHQKIADFFGVSKNTIVLAVRGKPVKIGAALVMIEWLLSRASKTTRELFIKKFSIKPKVPPLTPS